MSKQTVRTTVEGHVFAELQAQADAADISLFLHVRNLLTAAAEPSLLNVTPEMWADLAAWVKADPTRIAGYTGLRDFKRTDCRQWIYEWACSNGFTPSI